MNVKMVKGSETIEWTLISQRGAVIAKQVDRTGGYRVPFESEDLAGAWIIAQAEFMRNEVGFNYCV